MKIPKSFKLFGTTINIVWDNLRMNDVHAFGLFEYAKSQITLANKDGIDDISEYKILDTFYHEKVHAILTAMRERELSDNEKFVDVFAKLLRQADETSIYEQCDKFYPS